MLLASSTMWPSCITITLSVASSTMPRSWLMRMAVKCSARCSSLIVSMTACCTSTSSAVVGSSNTISCGSSESAERDRCALTHAAGELTGGSGASTDSSSPTLPISSLARASRASLGTWPCAAKMSRKWLPTVRTGLSAFMPDCSTMANPPWRWRRSSSASSSRMSRPPKRMRPALIRAGGFCSRVSAKPRVDLPDPDSPTSPTNSPRAQRERDVLDRGDGLRARRGVLHGEPLHVEQDVVRQSAWSRVPWRSSALPLSQARIGDAVHAEVDQCQAQRQQCDAQTGGRTAAATVR